MKLALAQKGKIFWVLFWLYNPMACTKKDSQILKPWGISMLNLTLINWRYRMMSQFLDISKAKMFPLVARHNLAKFDADRKRHCGFTTSKRILTILLYFETCLHSFILLTLQNRAQFSNCSRVPTWRNIFIFTTWALGTISNHKNIMQYESQGLHNLYWTTCKCLLKKVNLKGLPCRFAVDKVLEFSKYSVLQTFTNKY